MEYKEKNNIDSKGSRERKCCQQQPPYYMPTTYVEAIYEKVYAHLSAKNVLPDEQNSCRKDSRRTKDQLLIDKQILKYCKKHQRNLAMKWINYKKAYDMMPHGSIIEAMEMVRIPDNIVNLFENKKETWRTELIAYNQSLEEVNIRIGNFQGDSFSPLVFVVVLIPLLIILNETDLRYVTSQNQKLNYLLFWAI